MTLWNGSHALAGPEYAASGDPPGLSDPGGGLMGTFDGGPDPGGGLIGTLDGSAPARRTYRATVLRWTPRAWAIRRFDQPR